MAPIKRPMSTSTSPVTKILIQSDAFLTWNPRERAASEGSFRGVLFFTSAHFSGILNLSRLVGIVVQLYLKKLYIVSIGQNFEN